MRRRAMIGCGALVAAGSVLAAVVMVGASDGGRGAAQDAGRSPATLDEVRARTVAAPQARYAAEVHVAVAPRQTVVVREVGAFDLVSGHAWSETSSRRSSGADGADGAADGAEPEIVDRLRITPTGVYLQPVRAAASLGLLPTAWLGMPVDPAGPSPAEALADSLGDMIDDAAPADVAVDVRVDGEGRLRRLRAVRGPTTVRLDIVAYGDPVTVEQPDEAQVATNDLTALRSTLAALGGG